MCDAGTDSRQGFAELMQMHKFRLAAQSAPGGVISVLLAAFCIHTCCLQMAVFVFANPDAFPGRRQYEAINASQFCFIFYRCAIQFVGKTITLAKSENAGLTIAYIAQVGGFGACTCIAYKPGAAAGAEASGYQLVSVLM